jgi:hypothetical protein
MPLSERERQFIGWFRTLTGAEKIWILAEVLGWNLTLSAWLARCLFGDHPNGFQRLAPAKERKH